MASYRALALGATPFEVGLLPASFAALSLIVAVPAGRWIDRTGEGLFLLFGTVIMTVSVALMIWVDSVAMLLVTQTTLGLGHIINIISAQTMIANRTRPEDRDARFGYYSVAASLAQLIGPISAGVIAGSATPPGGSVGESATLVFAVATLTSLPAVLLALVLLAGPKPQGRPAPDRSELGYLRSAATIIRMPTMLPAIAISVGVILSIDLLVVYVPVYGEENGLSVELVGALLSVRAAASMASRLAMPRLIRRFGRARLLFGSSAIAGMAIGAVPFLSSSWALITLMAIAGLGIGFGQPMTVAWVVSRAPKPLRATALGVRLTATRVGQLTIPAAIGLAAGALGIAAVFWSLAAVLLGSALLVRRTPFDADKPEGRA